MFKITEEQLNKVLLVLGEVPSKFSFEVIKILITLEKIEEKDKE